MSELRCNSAFRARFVFPGDRPPLADGFVRCDGPTIGAVGQYLVGDAADDVVDLGSALILPGLINVHTHLEFSDLAAPLGEPGGSFADWIRAVVAYRRGRAEMQGHAAVIRGLDECRRAGTTALGEIATAGSFSVSPFQNERRGEGDEPIETTAFFELLGLSAERTAENLAAAKRHLALLSSEGLRVGLSPHAPYTVRCELVQKAAALAREAGAPLAMHLAESREELELLQSGGGPLRELLVQFDAWDPTAFRSGGRPLDYLRILADAPKSLVIHGTYLNDEEIGFAATHADRMAVVYCPRTQARLSSDPYPLAKLLAAGATVALGTDSRASNPDLSLFNELRYVAAHHSAAPDRILALATSAGAKALGRERDLGTLAAGKSADMTIIRVPNIEADPYELLFDPRSTVAATIRRGVLIAGNLS